MLNKLFTILVTALGFNTCFAQTAIDFNSDDEALEVILANRSCVAAIEEEKVYLKTDRIYPTNEGLFIDLNGQDSVLLNTLNSDCNGCYVAASETLIDVHKQCPDCGARYIVTCPNKNCPSKARKAAYEEEGRRKKEEYKRKKQEEKEKKKREKEDKKKK